jgi:ATP-dependent DNA helicase RecG
MTPSVSFDSRLLPGVTWDLLQPSSIDRLRAEAVVKTPGHRWADLTHEALAVEAGLVVPNENGEAGVTVAGLLLFGTREAVRNFLPSQRTQAVYRPGNWKRGYREEIRANLFETFDALMAFAGRQLPEGFSDPASVEWHRDDTNPRDEILAEIFAHSLVTRDYAKPYPARFVIEADRVFMEHGLASAENEVETEANPLLAAVFREMGRATRPGAEDSAVARWGKGYFGIRPMIVKSTVYRILAPYPRPATPVPQAKPEWNLSELLSQQAPWEASKAAQAEVAVNQTALAALLDPSSREIPLPDLPTAPVFTPPAAIPVTFTTASPTPVVQGSATPALQGIPSPAPQADRTGKILQFCLIPRYRSEVQAHVGIVNRDYFRKDILNPLIEKGLLQPTLPDKPNSPNQQYRTVVSV